MGHIIITGLHFLVQVRGLIFFFFFYDGVECSFNLNLIEMQCNAVIDINKKTVKYSSHSIV